jgi:hypothetical protein
MDTRLRGYDNNDDCDNDYDDDYYDKQNGYMLAQV